MKKYLFGIIAVLVGVLVLSHRCYNSNVLKLRNELSKVQQIVGVLPENIVTQSTLHNHVLREVKRHAGTDTVTVTEVYVPVETEVVHTTTIDTVAMGELEQAQILLAQLALEMETVADSARVDSLRVAIQNLQRVLYVTEVSYNQSGFCLEPNCGAGLDSDFDIGVSLGARVFYAGRFGGGFQGTLGFPTDSVYRSEHPLTLSAGIYGDYRLKGFENISAKIFGEYDFTRRHGSVGAGLNFYWR